MAARAETDFLPAALEIVQRPPSPAGRALAWSLMGFFSIALAWACFGEVDIVATAQGKVIPSGRVKRIQPLEIGVVRRIRVHEGQHVRAGEPLIELDPTEARADLDRLERELLTAQLDEARFRRLARWSEVPPAETEVSAPAGSLALPPALQARADFEAVQLQQRQLASEWSEHQARLAALDDTVASRRAQLAATRSEVKKLEATLPLVTRRADSLASLAKKKLVAEQNWLELEEQRVGQQEELAALKNRAVEVAASLREATRQRQALEAGFRRQVLERLAETGRRIEQLRQERLKARQRERRQRLLAPVAGVVQQLAVHTIGAVVTPAQELMRIVPQGDVLEVEAWVLNRDIGFVEAGQAAEVKVEAFPFTRYGVIDGSIVAVSGDAVTDERLGLVYAARVRLRQSAIRVGERMVELSPGMAVTVELKTGRRRLIEFILSPLLRYRDESLGER